MSKDFYHIIANSIDDWGQALDLFSKSTGLIVSLYLPSGQRVCGPFGNTPLAKQLLESGKFASGQICHYTEQRELLKIRATGKNTFHFFNTLRIDGVPIMFNDQLIAIAMIGWVFDHFPDPIECDRLANNLDLPHNQLWQVVRLQSPVSSEKFSVFNEMLSLLTGTLSKQLYAVYKLKESAKNKDDLLAIVSHELKTPLTSLLLRIQMLKAHKVDPGNMNSFLSSMEVNARLEAKLIDDLLDAARMVTGKYAFEMKLMDLNDVIQSVRDMMSDAAAEKGIELSMTWPEEPSPYIGDPTRLSQVLINLISNSIKFTPRSGKIAVTLHSKISKYEIFIEDNGKGIDKNFLPEMFQLFSQEKASQSINSGLGLGLALVKHIIDLHHGQIEVQSLGEDHGTRFEISLPKDEFMIS